MPGGADDDDLRGVPPAGVERVRRQRASGVRGSLLSAPAAAAVRSAGLEPVGEVFGCVVVGFGWTGGGCGYAYGWNTTYPGGRPTGPGTSGYGFGVVSPVVVSGSMPASRYAWGRSYAHAVQDALEQAHRRMLAEARALGADGVLGLTRSVTALGVQGREYATLGTAVRHLDPALRRRPGAPPWAAALTGEDVAAAASAGLRPAGVAYGYSLGLKHEDWQLRQQRTTWTNQEVDGLTELLRATRADARRSLARQSRSAAPGGGHVVVTETSLTTFDRACTSDAKDVLAEALFVGTVLEPHPAPPPRRGAAPTVLPLTPPTAAARRTR